MSIKQKLISVMFVFVLLGSSAAVPASAVDTAYNSYTYWLGYDEKSLVGTKEMYRVETMLTAKDFSLNDFLHPIAITTDEDSNIYILEENRSRLVILNSDNSVNNVLTEFHNQNGESQDFSGGNDICVANGLIYISDSVSKQVIVGDTDGNLKLILSAPQSDVVPSDFAFSPMKVAVNSRGYIYVLSTGSTYGSLLYNSDGKFEGFVGSNSVTGSVTGALSRIWDLLFMSDEQRAGQVQKIPYQFNDICIDDDDLIYTVTGATSDTELISEGQIRCLNASGQNVLRVKQKAEYVNSDSFNFGDSGISGETNNFVSIQTDSQGFIYVLDDKYGKIFVYDQECNLLSAFGGLSTSNTQKGTFENARDIALAGDCIYVTDYSNSTITVFKTTEYGNSLKNADTLFLNGDYEAAGVIFEDVLNQDGNCQIAYRGLAKSFYLKEDYQNALIMAKKGLDYGTYNQAFVKLLNENMKQSFTAFIVSVLVIIILILLLIILLKKRKIQVQFIIPQKLKHYLLFAFHPFDIANQIKNQNGGSVTIASVSMVLFYFFKVLEDTAGGFLFNTFDRNTYNSIYTFLGSVGIAVLWVVCYWAVSVIFSGKSKIKEVFIVTCYALLPHIINSIFFLIVSNLFSADNGTLISVFSVLMCILSGIILCIGCMVISEFDFFKWLLNAIVSVVAMGIVVFLIFLVLVLDQQLYIFVKTIIMEIICKA